MFSSLIAEPSSIAASSRAGERVSIAAVNFALGSSIMLRDSAAAASTAARNFTAALLVLTDFPNRTPAPVCIPTPSAALIMEAFQGDSRPTGHRVSTEVAATGAAVTGRFQHSRHSQNMNKL